MDNISKVYELMRNNDFQNNYDIHKSAYENNFVRLKKIICKTDDEKEKYDEILNETVPFWDLTKFSSVTMIEFLSVIFTVKAICAWISLALMIASAVFYTIGGAAF